MRLAPHVVVLLVSLLFVTSASAEDCSHLVRQASLDMTPTRADVVVIPVMINGTETHMLLDTGGGVSSVSRKLSTSLNLAAHDAAMKMLDMRGNASRKYVGIDTFGLGGLKGKNVDMMIWPDPEANFDGLIAGDILSRYDVELNFATRKFNIFSPDHCEGKVVYWPATAVAVVPFTMARPATGNPEEPTSIQMGPDTHIRVPVTLDGKTFTAIIDTGATFTTMNAVTARSAFDLTADSPGMIPVGHHDADQQMFGYVFHTLAFEGIAVTNPHVLIHPQMVGKKDPDNTNLLGSRISRRDDDMSPDLLIGMDVLKRLHLYIAYRERKLYITSPDQPAASSASR
jgi:predicted aspartyl protease